MKINKMSRWTEITYSYIAQQHDRDTHYFNTT